MKSLLIAAAVALLPVPAVAQDCEALLSKSPLKWDSRYDGKTGEEIGKYFGRRIIEDPNDLEAQVFFMFDTAKRHNLIDAQYNMGVYLRDGLGVTKDTASAACWFTLAAKQGDVDAQINLAAIYFDENEQPKDIRLAHMWAAIASSLGDEGAKKLMLSIQGYMGFNQMKEGWRLASVCLASRAFPVYFGP